VPAAVAVIGASGLAWWAVEAHDVPATGPSYQAVVQDIPTGEQAAPAAGVTGTIELPAMPSFASEPAQAAAVGARPFSTAKASAADRARALECLTAAIYYEAASEPDAGQRAVAQVVLNRVRHPAFPATVCGVVYQGSERRGCQFSFACDGAMARAPNRAGWARAAGNAWGALAGQVYAPVGLATHYHTFAVRPVWNRGLVMTDVVGAHFFHRWKGWWGTGAAFGQAYRGGEPMPGPHGTVAAVPPIVAAAVAPVPVQPGPVRSDVPPAIAASGVSLTPAPVEDRLPPASEVLDRWKDSGAALK
jgi:spore germination cell wall hydrolase CwlJ-like protein